jgi:hypothetical protein
VDTVPESIAPVPAQDPFKEVRHEDEANRLLEESQAIQKQGSSDLSMQIPSFTDNIVSMDFITLLF